MRESKSLALPLGYTPVSAAKKRQGPEPKLPALTPYWSGVGKGTRTLDTRNHKDVYKRQVQLSAVILHLPILVAGVEIRRQRHIQLQRGGLGRQDREAVLSDGQRQGCLLYTSPGRSGPRR